MKFLFRDLIKSVRRLLGLKKRLSKKDIVVDCSVLSRDSSLIFEYEDNKRPLHSFKLEELRAVTLSEDRHLWLNRLLERERLSVDDIEQSYSKLIKSNVDILALKLEFGIPYGEFRSPTRVLSMVIRVDCKIYNDTYSFVEL